MQQDKNKKQKQDSPAPQSRRPLLFWIILALSIATLIYVTLAPSLLSGNASETEVSYDTFLSHLEKGYIEKVEIRSNQVRYTLTKEGENALQEQAKEKAQQQAEASPSALPEQESLFGFRILGQGDAGNENGTAWKLPTAASAKKEYFAYLVGDEKLTDRLQAAGVTFSAVSEERFILFYMILQYGLPLLVFGLILAFLIRRLGKVGAGGGLMGFGKSNARSVEGSDITTTFKDVAGQDEAKESLQEIVSYLHDPRKYAEVGAKMPRGALLYGPPGTGKTLLARAVAGEAGVPFLSISGPEFVELFVGMGASKVRDLFKEAREKAPCIVFIDEIDAVAKKRDGMGSNDEREQTLNQLLSEMDGFEENSGVIVLAATNRPDSLDKALLRPGRFDRRVPVELPDQGGREAILRIHAAKVKTQGDIDLAAIARITPGASGADLANVVNEAALCAVRNGRRAVIQRDLEDSVDTALAGKQRKSMVISRKEKQTIAYHEVGHAIVTACQEHAAPVHKITIIPRTSGALGFTLQADEGEHFLMDKEEAFAKLVTLAGGRAAEQIMCHSVTTGASNDIEEATKLARAMITRYGMSDKLGFVAFEQMINPYLSSDTALTCSQDTAARIDREVIELVQRAYETALKLLEENRSRLEAIAGTLMEKETISGEEFEALMKQTDSGAETSEEPKET